MKLLIKKWIYRKSSDECLDFLDGPCASLLLYLCVCGLLISIWSFYIIGRREKVLERVGKKIREKKGGKRVTGLSRLNIFTCMPVLVKEMKTNQTDSRAAFSLLHIATLHFSCHSIWQSSLSFLFFYNYIMSRCFDSLG